MTMLERRLATSPPGEWERLVCEELAASPLFFGHGAADAEQEGYWIIEHCRNRKPFLDPQQLPRFINDVVRRRIQQRIPLAYLLNEAWFAGLLFYVDERVLIPRSPLAEIIERGLAPWHKGTGRLLDLGTGSGCLALACAYHCQFDRIDAVDVSEEALSVAAINTRLLEAGDTVRVLRSDVFSALGETQYDVIIANPPYVPENSMTTLPEEYGHEPELALVAGPSGLDIVERIFEGIGRRLAPDGLLLLEVGEAAEALLAAYPKIPFLWLDFERGGDGVLALDGSQVRQWFA